MMHGKQHSRGKKSFCPFMEASPTKQPSATALNNAYQRVLATRKANASMLKWSLQFAAEEKERRTGTGVTLYLL